MNRRVPLLQQSINAENVSCQAEVLGEEEEEENAEFDDIRLHDSMSEELGRSMTQNVVDMCPRCVLQILRSSSVIDRTIPPAIASFSTPLAMP